MLVNAHAIYPAAQLVRGLRRLVSQEPYGLWQTWRHAILQLASTPTLQEQVKAETLRALRLPPPEPGVLLTTDRANLPTVLALVALYTHGGETTDTVRLQLEKGLEKLLLAAELTADETATYHQLVQRFTARLGEQKTFRLTQPATSRPLVLEVGVRVVLYLAALAGQMPIALFTALNFMVPLVMVLLLSRRARAIRKRYGNYFSAKGLPAPQLTLRAVPWQYALVAVSALLLMALPAVLEATDISAFAVIGLAYSLMFYSVQTRLCLPGFNEEAADAWLAHYQSDHEAQYSPDQNDGLLAELSITLKGQQQRVEAFVLEAALFGALAFSAFVQIMATEFVVLEEIPLFLDRLATVVTQLALLEEVDWHLLAGKNNLFSIICLETLACSLVFLTVVASRLRFNDHSQRVDAQLALAQAYNDKEEFLQVSNEAPEPSPLIQPRIQELSRRVRSHLMTAQVSLEKSDTVMAFMRYFRDLGVAFFFLVLVTSSLLFAQGLAFLFVAVFVFGLTYHRANAFIENIRTLWQRVEEFYLRRSALFEWGPWLLIALAVSLALFRWPGDGLVALLGVLILIASIILRPTTVGELHYEALSTFRIRTIKLIRRLHSLGLFFLIIGMGLFVNHAPGAGGFLIIGFVSVALYFAPLSLWLGPGFRWANLWLGWGVAFGMTGILFRILHFPGADEFMIMGGAGVVLSVALVTLPSIRARVPGWFLNHAVVGGIMVLAMAFTPLFTVVYNSSLGYGGVVHVFRFEQNQNSFSSRLRNRGQTPLNTAECLKYAQTQLGHIKAMRDANPQEVGYRIERDCREVLIAAYAAALHDTARQRLTYAIYLAREADTLITRYGSSHFPEVTELVGVLQMMNADSTGAAASFRRADSLATGGHSGMYIGSPFLNNMSLDEQARHYRTLLGARYRQYGPGVPPGSSAEAAERAAAREGI